MRRNDTIKGTLGNALDEGKRPSRPVVAILTNYPLNGAHFTGGVETATAGLLEGLREYTEEFDFHVVALSKDIGENKTERRSGMTFHFLAVPTSWYTRPHVIANVVNARKELRRIGAELVHCQDNMALAVAAIAAGHSQNVFTVHGVKGVEARVWEGPEYWSHKVDALLEKWVRGHFTDVISVSPYVDQFLPNGVRSYQVTNPVSSIFFECPQQGINHGRILFVGVLTRLKRPLDVIRAFKQATKSAPELRLTIVGAPEDRSYEKEMRSYISQNEITGVEFLGTVPQEMVARLMRESTTLVLSSVQENTPMVIGEAMASGLPVVASRVGGVPAMVTDEVDGLLFDCGDVNALTEKITRVLQDRELREMLSRNGRAKAVSSFSPPAVARRMVAVYRELLSG